MSKFTLKFNLLHSPQYERGYIRKKPSDYHLQKQKMLLEY